MGDQAEASRQISLVGVQVGKGKDVGWCPEDAPRQYKATVNLVDLVEWSMADFQILLKASSGHVYQPCLDGSEEQRKEGVESVLKAMPLAASHSG